MEAVTVAKAAASDKLAGSNPEMDLVQRHRYGDSGAFEEIHVRFAGMVYNLAFRLAGTREEAEDLMQEVFLRIHRHLGRFNGRSTLKTWIYRITVNHCRSKLGRRRLPTQPLAEEVDGPGGVELKAQGRSPEERALAQDAARTLGLALRELKPVFREVVVLRDIEGLSYEEIAAVLGTRLGTVRSRIARGRQKLGKILRSRAAEERR